ncbi:MAG: putative RNA-binding protein with PUA-like domain [Planctomycetota bacterium]|jgi:predicted RNA-binding protein with PUA-like domain
MNYWLFKSEPNVYPIDTLAAEKGKRTFWDGVRNYQARNIMRDEMKKGDLAFFYHSRVKPMSVVGVVEIVKEGYPDHTQFDSTDSHFDPKATEENPRWFMVDMKLKKTFKRPITLTELKEDEKLDGLMLTAKGSRLSVQPVSKKHFDHICKLAES